MENDRPTELFSFTRRVITGCGNQYVTVAFKDGKPYEIQVELGKAGGCAAAFIYAIKSLVSASLAHGMPIDTIVSILEGIKCHKSIDSDSDVDKRSCCPDGIAEVLRIAKDRVVCPVCGSLAGEDGKCLNSDCEWVLREIDE